MDPDEIERSKSLIVEDDRLVRESFVQAMNVLGYECDTCENGESAVELMQRNHNYSVVFSDVNMPGGLDGIELAKWIRQERCEVSVVLMSGNKLTQELDGVVFLSKPFPNGGN